MIKSGEWVAENVIADGVVSKQVQPAGVDLTLSELYDISELSTFELLGDDRVHRNRDEVSMVRHGDQTMYEVDEGWYLARYNEVVDIPDNVVGFVWPRSTLMRNGVMVTSAVWDPGYKGQGFGGLYTPGRTLLGNGERIAQIVFMEVRNSTGTYDGEYQGEGLDE